MASSTHGGAISGVGSLTKLGGGSLFLDAANTYTGTTTLSAGTLNLGVAEIAGTSGPLGQSAANNPGSIVLGGGYAAILGRRTRTTIPAASAPPPTRPTTWTPTART